MKKTLLLLSAATLALAACNKNPEIPEAPAAQASEGVIQFTIEPQDGASTKAGSPFSTELDYETTMNRLQIYVFDASGKIVTYYASAPSTKPGLTGSITTTPGQKTVYALVNGPEIKTVGTLSELEAYALGLGDNSTSAATGFVMAGSANCTVSGTTPVACSISISRLLSRIALTRINNRLPPSYGNITLNYVYLNNVVGNQNVAGTAAPATWYNKDGRADESSRNADHIINGSGYNATYPALTFKSLNQSVGVEGAYIPTNCVLYTYPNSNMTAPNGYTDPFTPKSTVLTVVATIDGQKQFFPVVLNKDALARNTSYTVELTITGPGSEDPNIPAERGSVNFTLSPESWSATIVYDEVI